MSDEAGERELKTPEGARSSREALIALQHVYRETEALFNQSSAFFAQIYGEGDGSRGRRDVLLALWQSGPLTVPQLAHEKLVSRQYIQRLVNRLGEEKYVEVVENAAHKRSHLIQLTARGREYIADMRQHEAKIVAEMVIDIPVEKLRETGAMLRAIREWQKHELGRLLQGKVHEDEEISE